MARELTLQHKAAIEDAYQRLGVTHEQVASVPQITPFLRKFRGQIRIAIHYLRGSEDEVARKFLAVYDSPEILSEQQRKVCPIEAICLAAKISPPLLRDVIVIAAIRQNAQEGAIIAAINHPHIVRKSIQFAEDYDGFRDREFLFKHNGFLPAPKGTQVNVAISNNNVASSQSAGELVAAPPPEDTVRRLVDRFNRTKGLPAAPPESVIDQPFVESDVRSE